MVMGFCTGFSMNACKRWHYMQYENKPVCGYLTKKLHKPQANPFFRDVKQDELDV